MSRRTDIISDLEEQISELTAVIEQMNRDHQSAQKLVSDLALTTPSGLTLSGHLRARQRDRHLAVVSHAIQAQDSTAKRTVH